MPSLARPALLIGCLLLLPANADAQDQRGWSFTLTPYLWLPSLDSSLDIGDNPPAESSTSLSEVLQGAFLLAGEAQNGPWSIFGELNYLDFGDTIDDAVASADLSWGISGYMLSANLGYAFVETTATRAEGFVGLRGWWITAETELGARDADASRNWVDPLVGGRVATRLGDRVDLRGMANVGGFGVGSDLQYEALALVTYDMTDLLTLGAGYRHLHVDFDSAGFLWDATFSGPLFTLDINF